MKFIFNGKNFPLTEALKNRTEAKLSKLGKFFKGDVEVFVTMEVHRSMQKMEVTIPYEGIVFRAESASDDMYSSLDKVVDILERQFRKNKTRLERKLHSNGFAASDYQIKEIIDEEKDYKIIKTKHFPIKPIDVDEAILQMNLLGHEFFVFINALTNDVNVVYKRKDGDYGLLEPEY